MGAGAGTAWRNAVASTAWGLFAGSVGAFWAPLLITRFHDAYESSAWWAARVVGAALIAAGLALTVATVTAFVRAGGTPIPGVLPPQLVVRGPNAYVRNPIYLGMLVIILGETLVLGRWILLAYGLLIWVVTAVFVRVYEEPALARRFDGQYDAYRHAVPAWRPLLHAWSDMLEVEVSDPLDEGPFFHGTIAELQAGDLVTAGFRSNYRREIVMNHVYFTALRDGAGLAAELAALLADGDPAPRVYVVEPTGWFENDPNVTDKKFPGNPTRSYRSSEPLRIVGEVTDWPRLAPEALLAWQERLTALLADERGEIIN